MKSATFCYLSIDIHLNLLHVRFGDKLSISVSKNKATRHNNLQLETVKFLKKSNLQSPLTHFILHRAFFHQVFASSYRT
jgi:hypothetical protein